MVEELALAEEQQGLEPEEPIDPATGAPIDDLASLFDLSLLNEGAGAS